MIPRARRRAGAGRGHRRDGPISADTLFYRAYNGAFDLVVAQYHDQGHIPIKLVAFDTAVNVSVGTADRPLFGRPRHRLRHRR